MDPEDKAFVKILLTIVLFTLVTATLATVGLVMGVDKAKTEYNQCRDKGGSVLYCATGLK